jgi:hypothetical protein
VAINYRGINSYLLKHCCCNCVLMSKIASGRAKVSLDIGDKHFGGCCYNWQL